MKVLNGEKGRGWRRGGHAHGAAVWVGQCRVYNWEYHLIFLSALFTVAFHCSKSEFTLDFCSSLLYTLIIHWFIHVFISCNILRRAANLSCESGSSTEIRLTWLLCRERLATCHMQHILLWSLDFLAHRTQHRKSSRSSGRRRLHTIAIDSRASVRGAPEMGRFTVSSWRFELRQLNCSFS